MNINNLLTESYLVSDLQIISSDLLKKSFRNFLSREEDYKYRFLQKEYSNAFDGYSYLGQADSSNQDTLDLLHSFVISDFCNYLQFPEEFHPFFTEEWDILLNKIKQLELSVIEQLKIPNLKNFYTEHIGHMISCNYYPATKLFNNTAKNNTRLSEHTDASLFTVFPFGFDSDFQYQDTNKSWNTIKATDCIVLFSGYLLDYFTNGKIKALNHQVKLPDNQTNERFSFAYFSLPIPKRQFNINGQSITSENYFKKYLSSFS